MQAKKLPDSPHGRGGTIDTGMTEENAAAAIEGAQYKPKMIKDANSNKLKLSPFH